MTNFTMFPITECYLRYIRQAHRYIYLLYRSSFVLKYYYILHNGLCIVCYIKAK